MVVPGDFRQLSSTTYGLAQQVNMGGGVTNLLRMARSECRGLVAFVAAAQGGGLEVASFPAGGGQDPVGPEAVCQLVGLSSSDPEFGHGGPFVRTVILDGFLEPVTVAVAPLGSGGERGLLGVVGQEPSDFGEHQRRTLERVAQRLTRHLAAREEVEHRRRSLENEQLGPTVHAPDPPGYAPSPSPEEVLRGPTASSSDGSAWESTEPVVPPWANPQAPDDGSPAIPTHGGFRAAVPPVRWSVPTPSAEGVGDGNDATVFSTSVAEPAGVPVVPGEEGDHHSPPWEEADAISGLPGLGSFFSRTGRVMGGPEPRAVAMVVIEIHGVARPEELVVQLAASTLRSQLRASDPLARVGRCAFVAAIALEPGSSLAPVVEQRLAGAVRSAVAGSTPQAGVRSTHMLSEPEHRVEADELLRRSLRQMHST